MDNLPLDITVLGVKVIGVPYHTEVDVNDAGEPVGEPVFVITEKTKLRCRTLAVKAKKKGKVVTRYV